jgi:hypothetical protein
LLTDLLSLRGKVRIELCANWPRQVSQGQPALGTQGGREGAGGRGGSGVTARKVALAGATAMVGAMASPENQANLVASTELQTHRWLLSRRVAGHAAWWAASTICPST